MPNAIPNIKGFRFMFYSNEGDEPPQVHITKGDGVAKWWLDPHLEEEYCYFKVQECKIVKHLVKENHQRLIKSWNEYFNKK